MQAELARERTKLARRETWVSRTHKRRGSSQRNYFHPSLARPAKALSKKEPVHSPSQMGCLALASFTHTHARWHGSENGLPCMCEFYTPTAFSTWTRELLEKA